MDKLNDDLDLREEWGPFPELRTDVALNPFERQLDFWSATTHYLYEIALRTSGASDMDGWQERLREVERIACGALFEPEKSLTKPFLLGFPVTAAGQPALAFLDVCEEGDAIRLPRAQLFGSLALWLLVEAYRLARIGRSERASQLEVQAAFALAICLGENGREVMAAIEKARRSEIGTANANTRHAERNREKEEMLEEFRKDSWPSKARAAAILGPKYGFAEETVQKLLRSETLKASPKKIS